MVNLVPTLQMVLVQQLQWWFKLKKGKCVTTTREVTSNSDGSQWGLSQGIFKCFISVKTLNMYDGKISSCVCDDKTRYFKPKHGLFCTLIKCFFVLKLPFHLKLYILSLVQQWIIIHMFSFKTAPTCLCYKFSLEEDSSCSETQSQQFCEVPQWKWTNSRPRLTWAGFFHGRRLEWGAETFTKS